jgi:hypothetical protein
MLVCSFCSVTLIVIPCEDSDRNENRDAMIQSHFPCLFLQTTVFLSHSLHFNQATKSLGGLSNPLKRILCQERKILAEVLAGITV